MQCLGRTPVKEGGPHFAEEATHAAKGNHKLLTTWVGCQQDFT